MFCSKCGRELADDAILCDGCGAKIGGEPLRPKPEPPKQEARIHKCPYCGATLPYGALECPICGMEISGREATQSIQSLFEKINSLDEEEKKIQLVKTFPIPNSREDILEFMFLAVSNFDAKYYATNKNRDSLASAWYSKIEQCYQKGKLMLQSKSDLAQLENLYAEVNRKTEKVTKIKILLIVLGFLAITAGLVVVVALGTNNTAIGAIGLALIAGGVVSLVFGFKRKKTIKEVEAEKTAKAEKRNKK